jgi:hypothetical protein
VTLDPQQITIIALLFAIGAAGLKKLWVFGWTYADKVNDLVGMTKDRDFWRDTALRSMGHTDRAIEVASRQSER